MFSKHLTTLLGLAAALYLAGCAAEGIIVKKTFRPLPFSYSLGVDGIYKFELEDRQKTVREQMVTRDVFVRYEVGDFFSDRMEAVRATAENAQRDAARLGGMRLPNREPNSFYEDEPFIAPKRDVHYPNLEPESIPKAHPELAPTPTPKPVAKKVENISIAVHSQPSPKIVPVKPKPTSRHAVVKAKLEPVKKSVAKKKPKHRSTAASKAAAAKAMADQAESDTANISSKPDFRGIPEPQKPASSPGTEKVLTPKDRPTPASTTDTEGF